MDRPGEDGKWTLELLTSPEAAALVIDAIGLDPDAVDFTCDEALAALVRYAASIIGPAARRALAARVLRLLRGFVTEGDGLRERIGSTIDRSLAHGDLVEISLPGDRGVTLCLGSARFVLMDSGVAFILGGHRDGLPMLPPALLRRVDTEGHSRRIYQDPEEDLGVVLRGVGVIQVPARHWLVTPDPTSPQRLLDSLNARLRVMSVSSEVEGLIVLDQNRPVRYYRGRWTDPKGLNGTYVARRAQQFGADLWCYVQLEEGSPSHLVDLPLGEGRGCDEAWTIQLAMDSIRGTPQMYRSREVQGGQVIVEFFSPLPAWAQRRLDSIGHPMPVSGALFAYRLGEREFQTERGTLENSLWLSPQVPVAMVPAEFATEGQGKVTPK